MICSGPWEKAMAMVGKLLCIELTHADKRCTVAHSHLITFSQTNNGSWSCDSHTFPHDTRPLFSAKLRSKKARIDNIEGVISKFQRLGSVHHLKTDIRK